METHGEEAKRFDLLLLKLELALLRSEPRFERLRDQGMEIAGLLEEKQTIPMVRHQLALIQDVQSEEWWQDVKLPMLERVRRRLRLLVRLIDVLAHKGQPIRTLPKSRARDAHVRSRDGARWGSRFHTYGIKELPTDRTLARPLLWRLVRPSVQIAALCSPI